MKKLSLLVVLAILFMSVLLPVYAIAGEKSKSYTIEQLTPEWIMMTAELDDYGFHYKNFAQGIKELSKKCVIISIEAVNELWGRGSATKALFIKVKPK